MPACMEVPSLFDDFHGILYPLGAQEGEIPLVRARIWNLESAHVQSFELQVLFEPWLQRASPITVFYGQGALLLRRFVR